MNKLYVFSGAGLSADSGVPTFRSDDGLWKSQDFDKICNFNTWLDNYDAVHKFYSDRRVDLGTVKPNSMHKVLADLQIKYGTDVVELWTQNIDDLLERSGAKQVNHIHGVLTEVYCTNCYTIIDIGYSHEIPDCSCGCKIIKPNVVFFNQNAPKYSDLLTTFHKARADKNSTILIIGTSGSVVPFEWIVGKYKEPSFKILCNKDPIDFDMSVFDMCFMDNADKVSENLKLALTDRIEGIL